MSDPIRSQTSQQHFAKGDLVRYHPIIGGPDDGKTWEIVDFGSINGTRDVCWLLGKRGCVSTRAISRPPQQGDRHE